MEGPISVIEAHRICAKSQIGLVCPEIVPEVIAEKR